MRPREGLAALVVVGILAGCGGSGPDRPLTAPPSPRRSVVWVGADGLDDETAARLQRVGVDQAVVRRGAVDLSGDVPVLRLSPAPSTSVILPKGFALEVSRVRDELDASVADTLWQAISADLGDASPAELVLDIRQAAMGLAPFVARLSAISGVPVVPLVVPTQLVEPGVIELVAAARAAIVPLFGAVEQVRPGAEQSSEALEELLAPLRATGARIRAGVVLQPEAQPGLGRWGDELDLLCEDQVTEISTVSSLDRTFVFNRAFSWSGRDFARGERLALRWMDVARLDASLAEAARLVLPELGGWDLMPIPPADAALGMSREALIAYLGGRGPQPEIEVKVDRRGRQIQVRLTNPGPFSSALSAYGNWVEVAVGAGAVLPEERGSFDRLALGNRRGSEWQQVSTGAGNAVRFLENMVGPGEEIETGTVRLPSSESRATVRWNVVLTRGVEVTGELQR